MEPDRFQQNKKYYIVGLACLIMSMTLFGIGAYILPHVAFGMVYTIPDFIFEWTNLIQVAYGLSEKSSGWLVLLIFLVFGFLFSLVTYILSNRIDNEIYATEEPDAVVEEKKPIKGGSETGPLVLKIVLILGFIYIVSKFFQWAIASH